MSGMCLSEAADLMQAEYMGEDVQFSSVSTDTRTIEKGDLFVALTGEHFDGHDYVEQAGIKGASAAMVSRRLETMLPLLMVSDTRAGLGQLSAIWRKRNQIPLIAVTGSNGKTTVKEMIASILSQKGEVLATHGNLNNEIGVPLTLMRLQDYHEYGVVEMGANHAGEIGYLSKLTNPDVALITNAGPAHLEGFGSIEGVAHAKGEIFSGLTTAGAAVINADDDYASIWIKLAEGKRIISFGLEQESDVSADWQGYSQYSDIHLHTPKGDCQIKLPLPGRHNVMNALAATAASLVLDFELDQIKRGLEALRSVGGRLQFCTPESDDLKGMQLLDDTYNANPQSLAAALEVLSTSNGHKWLVLGDMAELGSEAKDLHTKAGQQARAAGVEKLFGLGALSQHAVQAFGEGGSQYADYQSLVNELREQWNGKGLVLVKGSRSMYMEKVVNALLGQSPPESVSKEGV